MQKEEKKRRSMPSSKTSKAPSINIEDLIDEEATVEDFEEYNQLFPDLDAVVNIENHCTSCFKHLGLSLAAVPKIRLHSILKVTICKECDDFYNSGEFERGEDGSELYCRWCGQGGEVYCCSKCIYVFCKECIKKNLGTGAWKKISKLESWDCFRCDSNQLLKLRARHHVFTNYLLNRQNHVNFIAKNPVQLKELMLEDMSNCCKKPSNPTTPTTTTTAVKEVPKQPEKPTVSKPPAVLSTQNKTNTSKILNPNTSNVNGKRPLDNRPGPLSKKLKKSHAEPRKSSIKPSVSKEPKPKPQAPSPVPSDDDLDLFKLMTPIVELDILQNLDEPHPMDPLSLDNPTPSPTVDDANFSPRPGVVPIESPPLPSRESNMSPQQPSSFQFGGHFMATQSNFTNVVPPMVPIRTPVQIRLATRNGPALYNVGNGFKIDLNSAANMETVQLPDGKILQVRRHLITNPNNQVTVNTMPRLTIRKPAPSMSTAIPRSVAPNYKFNHIGQIQTMPTIGRIPSTYAMHTPVSSAGLRLPIIGPTTSSLSTNNNAIPVGFNQTVTRRGPAVQTPQPNGIVPTLSSSSTNNSAIPVGFNQTVTSGGPAVQTPQPNGYATVRPRRKITTGSKPGTQTVPALVHTLNSGNWQLPVSLARSELMGVLQQLKYMFSYADQKRVGFENSKMFKSAKSMEDFLELQTNLSYILSYATGQMKSIAKKNSMAIMTLKSKIKHIQNSEDELQLLEEQPTCINLDSDEEDTAPTDNSALSNKDSSGSNAHSAKELLEPINVDQEDHVVENKTIVEDILNEMVDSLFPKTRETNEGKENEPPSGENIVGVKNQLQEKPMVSNNTDQAIADDIPYVDIRTPPEATTKDPVELKSSVEDGVVERADSNEVVSKDKDNSPVDPGTMNDNGDKNDDLTCLEDIVDLDRLSDKDVELNFELSGNENSLESLNDNVLVDANLNNSKDHEGSTATASEEDEEYLSGNRPQIETFDVNLNAQESSGCGGETSATDRANCEGEVDPLKEVMDYEILDELNSILDTCGDSRAL